MIQGPAISDAELGPELLARGCGQGALLEAPAQMLWLSRTGDAKPWVVNDHRFEESTLVVASQACDIYAATRTEPYVEALAARWSTNATEVHSARKGNSARLYLLTEDVNGRALLADARRRLHIDKRSLLSVKFTQVLPDERARNRFADWVAGRYNRPAIANQLVDAIQKPVVKALDTLLRGANSHIPIDRITELRFRASRDIPPLTVDFIAMVEEGEQLTPEEEAEFGGWLEETLVVEAGAVESIRLVFRNPGSVSLSDYLRTTRLQLDQYSPETESDAAA